MRKLLLLLSMFVMCLVVMQSCVVKKVFYSGKYDVSLDTIEKQTYSQQYSEINAVKAEVAEVGYSYEDSQLKINWNVLDKSYMFSLLNKTSYNIKILWDEAAYVDVSNDTHRLIHSTIKYQDCNKKQMCTIIPRGSNLIDLVNPTTSIRSINGNWYKMPLFINTSDTKEKLKMASNIFVGGKTKILLPIIIDGARVDYTFIFKINSFKNITGYGN